MKINKSYTTVFISLAIILLYSCSSVRKLDDNQVLLKRNSFTIQKSSLAKDDIKSYIRPKANKRFFGFKFHLLLYNLSGKADNGVNRWFRNIGEAPVIYDQYAVEKSSNQIKTYLFKKGYFNSIVTDSVKIRNKKAVVNYTIYTGAPYRINSIKYLISDDSVSSLLLADSADFVLKNGDIYDEDIILEHLQLLENKMHNNGYHLFSKNNILINADTTIGERKINLDFKVLNPVITNSEGVKTETNHKKFTIGAVNFFVGYEPSKALVDSTYFDNFKELIYSDISYFWIDSKKIPVNKKILEQAIFFKRGDLYSKEDVDLSYNSIQRLGIFKYVNIEFSEKQNVNNYPDNEDNSVVCNIYLTLRKPISFRADLEGTNSDGEFGTAGSFSFKHRNIFRGADLLGVKLRGAFEGVKDIGVVGFNNALEIGGEMSLITSRFLIPGNAIRLIRKYTPKTRISSSYYFQRRPSYTRSISNLSFGYIWSLSKYVSHSFNPLEYYKVGIFNTTNEFSTVLSQQPYLASSYIPHAITLSSYSFIYNNQEFNKSASSTFFHFNIEIAGNILSAYNNITNQEKTNNKYTLLGTQYSQFIKSDIDLRHNFLIDHNNTIATRVFFGVGYAYNNSETLPFEKRYFGGGSQGVRGWQVRTLGPGAFSFPDSIRYPDQTADIKLEMNLEYRYKIFKSVEGALFLDAGNIWDIKETAERPGAAFKIDEFYNDIAVATGLGLRVNLGFFIIRTDFGLKLRDPAIQNGSKWIFSNRSYGYNDWAFHFGIGYPF